MKGCGRATKIGRHGSREKIDLDGARLAFVVDAAGELEVLDCGLVAERIEHRANRSHPRPVNDDLGGEEAVYVFRCANRRDRKAQRS